MEQRTKEWQDARLGKFTASEVWRLMADCKRDMTDAELKSRDPKSRATTIVDPCLLSDGACTYVQEVASERITGTPAKVEFENDAMRWGKLYEPHARILYSEVYDVNIEEVGFVPYLDYAGASPDGLVAGKYGVEIKCPQSPAIHLFYRTFKTGADLKENKKEYYWQCMKGMLATGLKEWQFISYQPLFPVLKQLYSLPVKWNDTDIDLLKTKLEYAEIAAKYLETV